MAEHALKLKYEWTLQEPCTCDSCKKSLEVSAKSIQDECDRLIMEEIFKMVNISVARVTISPVENQKFKERNRKPKRFKF